MEHITEEKQLVDNSYYYVFPKIVYRNGKRANGTIVQLHYSCGNPQLGTGGAWCQDAYEPKFQNGLVRNNVYGPIEMDEEIIKKEETK